MGESVEPENGVQSTSRDASFSERPERAQFTCFMELRCSAAASSTLSMAFHVLRYVLLWPLLVTLDECSSVQTLAYALKMQKYNLSREWICLSSRPQVFSTSQISKSNKANKSNQIKSNT
jgi:hypothetical protein